MRNIFIVLKGIWFWFLVTSLFILVMGIDSIMEMGYDIFCIALIFILVLILLLKSFFTVKEAYIYSGACLLDRFLDYNIWRVIREEEKIEREEREELDKRINKDINNNINKDTDKEEETK